jgi:serine/threonine protein kinase
MDDASVTMPFDPPAPRRRARYESDCEVGPGAMGVVCEAQDTDLDRPVANKLLHRLVAGAELDAHRIERFTREARTMGRIVQPNVALIHQVGRHEGPVSTLPAALTTTVRRAAKSLADRCRSAGELLAALRELLAGGATGPAR